MGDLALFGQRRVRCGWRSLHSTVDTPAHDVPLIPIRMYAEDGSPLAAAQDVMRTATITPAKTVHIASLNIFPDKGNDDLPQAALITERPSSLGSINTLHRQLGYLNTNEVPHMAHKGTAKPTDITGSTTTPNSIRKPCFDDKQTRTKMGTHTNVALGHVSSDVCGKLTT